MIIYLPKAVVPQGGYHGAGALGLSDLLVSNLRKEMHIEKLFTMQAAVISYILRLDSIMAPGDILLSSPTGSGKTLAYALPIMHALKKRIVPRLRCLVVLPSRDLAMQVKSVFDLLGKGMDITITLVAGAESMRAEAAALESAEILIATPGRLVDHVKSTSALTLEHIRYLVVDESDRLLNDSFYGWIDLVVPRCGRAVDSSKPGIRNRGRSGGFVASPVISTSFLTKPRKILVSATQTANPKRLAKLDLTFPKSFVTAEARSVSTENNGPEIVAGGKHFHLPDSLTETVYVVDSPSEKLLVLVRLLGWVATGDPRGNVSSGYIRPLALNGTKLVFTKSVASAHRLRRLLELFAAFCAEVVPNCEVVEVSGDLPPEQRKKEVLRIRESNLSSADADSDDAQAKALVVICSDLLARGMDIGGVDAVVNYDVPPHIKTYLHRSGRTARAGRPGVVASIILSKEAHHFKILLTEADRGSRSVEFPRIDREVEEFENLYPKLSFSVNTLKRVVKREELGLLSTSERLPQYALNEFVGSYNGSNLSLGLDQIEEAPSTLEEDVSQHKRTRTYDKPSELNRGSVEVELDFRAAERAGEAAMEVDTVHDELDADFPKEGNVTDGEEDEVTWKERLEEGGTEPNSTQIQDSFEDLLRAQLMRNYFPQTSSS